ncbi:alpha/beta hydrolase, partial [Candidatus Peregrinibacteria bacterium]|nr:alpha/beta hydrolase [Candidatus Peregrinibacteria bacterium]
MPNRLKPEDVKYISLEGGGGKGNAFIGALEALMDNRINILQYNNYKQSNVLGFSGASAGAITALFLSCGYTPEEIKIITEIENFDNFFDR